MKNIEISKLDIDSIYHVLNYWGHATAKSSSTVGSDYIGRIEFLPRDKIEESVLKLFSFLKKEESNLENKYYGCVLYILDALREHYPDEWLIETVAEFLSKKPEGIDSDNTSLVEHRLISISWIQEFDNSFFSKDEIESEVSIKKFFHWDWIDLFLKTDCGDDYIEALVFDHVISEKEATADLIIRMTGWRHSKEAMVLSTVDRIIKSADFDISPLKRWRKKRFAY